MKDAELEIKFVESYVHTLGVSHVDLASVAPAVPTLEEHERRVADLEQVLCGRAVVAELPRANRSLVGVLSAELFEEFRHFGRRVKGVIDIGEVGECGLGVANNARMFDLFLHGRIAFGKIGSATFRQPSATSHLSARWVLFEIS